MKRRKEIFWGLLLILGAVLIMTSRTGFLHEIHLVRLILTIFLVGILVENLFQRSFGGILFTLAFLGIVYARELGILRLTPWPILAAALLGTIGLNMIFHKKREAKDPGFYWKDASKVIDMEEEGQVQCTVRFGETTKYIDSPVFRRADLESSFGSLGVYFDQAVPVNGNAQAVVNVSSGSMELYVPGSWKVVIDVDALFGGVDENGRYEPVDGGNTLFISGNVRFGGLEVHHI